jgi:hypothetical protein
MPGYGHPIEFGYFLVPDAADPAGVVETTRLADSLEALGAKLLAHLDYEGRSLEGTVLRIREYAQ